MTKFNSVNNISEVSSVIAKSAGQTTKKEAPAAEKRRRLSARKTQGRKGCLMQRINMAFSPENHEYLRVVSACMGKNMSEFVNDLITKYRMQHADIYEKAVKFKKEVEGLNVE